ncbi:hypothetical protein Ais01nite_00200 [Asanoa ishikariensis]|uniref:Uncharacterized protein n=1 Tax=Asanoa ishikariensis TaxID=137265 RepID=A0A1H3TQC9_9ACTN|nr:hypothetical protein [Asanoa ishikariensis]GIF61985.1 hypothetical protein Ais01nite_00200 [Asanoa ishikariensis]SDZ52444.1 hypothetical protein SAMN05421684_6203 [Asanoa ishikariensis]
MLPVTPQDSVHRFARSLEVPQRLTQLHPRTPGNAGNFNALPPAVVLGVISAFEGFVEDFLATALHLRGYGLGQIAKRVSTSNPTVADFQRKCSAEFPTVPPRIADAPPVRVWNIPTVSGRPATETIDWDEMVRRADGWMQVRHCLTHGLVSGWRSEVWPGPLRGATSASSVLRARPGGRHAIGLIGAISCARIHLHGARVIADAVAAELGALLDWTALPDFPLLRAAGGSADR